MTERIFGGGYHGAFKQNSLTLGIGVPLEAYTSPIPSMQNQIELIQKVERGGFAVLWCRDVPLVDPSFGDVGQIYDSWVWCGYVCAHTSTIALGTSSIILPLRNRVDLAKAAASVDELSNGRLVLGVASGDRPIEYSVYGESFEGRDEKFRQSFEFIKDTTHRPKDWNNQQVAFSGQVDLLPKSHTGDLPLLVTGNSRQSVDWIAQHADGWLMYPRPLPIQQKVVTQWHDSLNAQDEPWKPFAQSLYIDLVANPAAPAEPIHLGYRLGRDTLIAHLNALRDIGVNHVLFNIRFSTRPVSEVLDELIEFVIPQFPKLN